MTVKGSCPSFPRRQEASPIDALVLLVERLSEQSCCLLTRVMSYSMVQGTATIRLDN